MNETRTVAILQRVPAILAVTANSYGLSVQAGGSRQPGATGDHRRNERNTAGDKPAAQR